MSSINSKLGSSFEFISIFNLLVKPTENPFKECVIGYYKNVGLKEFQMDFNSNEPELDFKIYCKECAGIRLSHSQRSSLMKNKTKKKEHFSNSVAALSFGE